LAGFVERLLEVGGCNVDFSIALSKSSVLVTAHLTSSQVKELLQRLIENRANPTFSIEVFRG
jgi:hypothetical protein